jgi:hypothetical protein
VETAAGDKDFRELTERWWQGTVNTVRNLEEVHVAEVPPLPESMLDGRCEVYQSKRNDLKDLLAEQRGVVVEDSEASHNSVTICSVVCSVDVLQSITEVRRGARWFKPKEQTWQRQNLWKHVDDGRTNLWGYGHFVQNVPLCLGGIVALLIDD